MRETLVSVFESHPFIFLFVMLMLVFVLLPLALDKLLNG